MLAGTYASRLAETSAAIAGESAAELRSAGQPRAAVPTSIDAASTAAENDTTDFDPANFSFDFGANTDELVEDDGATVEGIWNEDDGAIDARADDSDEQTL